MNFKLRLSVTVPVLGTPAHTARLNLTIVLALFARMGDSALTSRRVSCVPAQLDTMEQPVKTGSMEEQTRQEILR